MRLVTLADVRELIEWHLPPQVRAKQTWRYIADEHRAAALGSDTADVAVALRLALSMEGVPCRPQ